MNGASKPSAPACAIAIVGCAGRFPGAADVPAFWQNLRDGVESISHFSNEELEDTFPAEVREKKEYVKSRAILTGVEDFDAPFFGMHAREAALTDPQHRVFLECAWQALEDAGCDPSTFGGSIGLYAGCSVSSYLMRNVLADQRGVARFTSDYPVASYPELLGSGYDFLATRVAYKLNLRGPAMTLQSACSTSLLAVAQACQALMLRQADMMLAGGVSITFPQRRGYVYQEGGMVSPDGQCRTFDAHAGGTVFGDGAGLVVLKRLEDAVADRDAIYAVIRGFGVNNDGSTKVGYTAPSADGQSAAVRAAHAMAGFDASTIGFIECHGTATPLGDPIEFAALSKALGPFSSAKKTCALGSLKTNVGHLDVASGVTGLIKAALAVREGEIPPTLHFVTPNPHIDLASGPFFVNTQHAAWPNPNATRRAAVSAFGVGGTNVHVVLEQAPPVPALGESGRPQAILLSARTEAALERARTRLAAHLRKTDAPLADVAHTLQVGRRAFPCRSSVIAASAAEAADALERPDRIVSGKASQHDPSLAFLYPGQGAQYIGMGRGLYDDRPDFRATFDRCAQVLKPILGRDLRAVLFESEDTAVLTATELAQPALFSVEYALADVLVNCGINPAASAGHSVGELVAACRAGVFSLEDALRFAAERGRLMQQLPPGTMLAVRAAESDVAPLLSAGVDLAAANAPGLSVVAGSSEAIERLERRLGELGIGSRRLQTSHAFHSWMMDPVLEPLEALVRSMRPSAPTAPYVSSVTGTWITAEDATSAQYWARHCREPVRFADALQTLVDAGVDTFVEVGPGATLATFALQGAAKGGRAKVIRTLSGSERERSDTEALLDTFGRLWTIGLTPNWSAASADAPARSTSLPTYPFERTRHWIDAATDATPPQKETPSPLLHQPKTDAIVKPNVLEHRTSASHTSRSERVKSELTALLEDLSGESLAGLDATITFLELGFDSLSLGRFVQQVQPRFGVAVTFRQLLSDIPSIATLAQHIVAASPPESDESESEARADSVHMPEGGAAKGTALEELVRDQLEAMQQMMRQHIATLKDLGAPGGLEPSAGRASSEPAVKVASAEVEAPSPVDAFRVAGAARGEITPAQRRHIDELVTRTVARTKESKRLTQRYRAVLADPRVAAGFRSEWKEMVYPITCARAKGARIWDVDGNEYIDVLNGFGQTAFGHSPDFVVDAVAAQLREGFAIGPQTELAGKVAELFCEITGNERVTFCNTGSEAVMAALRVARTVTNRDRVVVFEGSYHGQFDEVLVKSARTSRRSLPVSLGIPDSAVANITVLPYGTPESLSWIREHSGELAAVLVETVQSRHPALRPHEFLTELRAVTQEFGTALVFDEVVTGFRMHPGGMQAVFGVRADLATYGKVVGGGLPIGILAGKRAFMDALDGGNWQYGDDSFPEVAPMFMAGTFVRHPLAMAAVLSVLRHVKEHGQELYETAAQRTQALVTRLNADLERRGVRSRVETYGSLFYVNFAAEDRLASLLHYHLRLRGIYIQEGFPSFLGTAHSDADIDAIVTAFAASLEEMQSVGILCGDRTSASVAGPAEPQVATEVPLTEEQTEVWLAAQVSDEASCAFNESVTVRLDGPLDEIIFERALHRVVERHDALRATFGTTGEAMNFLPRASLQLQQSDFSGQPEGEHEAALARIIGIEARTPFNLEKGPAARAHLVRLAPDRHAFVFTAHHIVCDGWSINVILSEVAQAYAALSAAIEPELPPVLPFSDFASRQALRDPRESEKVESYWLDQFATPVPHLELPTDRVRPGRKTYAGATRTAFIDQDTQRSIKKSGARNGCTLFVTLLTAFDVLVGRLAQQEDIVVGVPAAAQSLVESKTLVGHCVDFLPIRSSREPGATLADLLRDTKRRVLDAYEHQQYTLGTLVRKLGLAREGNRVPLAEVQFNLERLADDLTFGPCTGTVEPNPKAFVNFDLFLNVVESHNGLRLDCDYNTDLFDAATIDRWLGYFRRILDELVRDAEQFVCAVDFLSSQDRELLSRLNDTASEYGREETVHGLLRATAALDPSSIALRFGDEALTYGSLARHINRFSNYLLARVNAPRARVAVCLERSPELPIALLATLSAGFTYIPLDPSHPPQRLRRILEDAGAAAIVCDGSLEMGSVPRGVATINIREVSDDVALMPATPPAVDVSATDPAYVIYTSGSTGQPKGVEVTHRSVVNLLSSMAGRPGLRAGGTLLALTTVSFDIAALELFLPLSVGATLAIASRDDLADAFVLLQRVRSLDVSAVQATPALWQLLLAAGFESSPGLTMLCGGEPLTRELANRLLAGGGALWNMYGPTETTIWSSCERIEQGSSAVSVGTPIANTAFYVLDANDREVPVGVVGQLHIAGDGVANGYVGNTELTAQKFVSNPFGQGRMYRTGDAARVTAAGTVQILGRLDHQVKLRGFRIELGEVEAVLREKGGLRDVAVVLREDAPGEPFLACYYTAATTVEGAALRKIAAESLPEYMIPSAWMHLGRMPLTAAGKLDRVALPLPPRALAAKEFRAPSTATELTLASIWCDVLHLESIGLDDEFFALGGDSIQLFQITARANKNGLRLAAKELLRNPTIATLGARLDELAAQPREPGLPRVPIARLHVGTPRAAAGSRVGERA